MTNDQSDLNIENDKNSSQGSVARSESGRQPSDSLMLPVPAIKDKSQIAAASTQSTLQAEDTSAAFSSAAGISQPVPVASPPNVKVAELPLKNPNLQASQLPALITRKNLITWIAIYFIAITVAESLTILLDTVIFGLVFYGLVLVALMMFSAAFAGHREQRIFLTLAFAPLIRLISMAIPMQGVPVMYRYMLVGAPIFISVFLVSIYAGFKREEIGLTLKNLPVQLLIAPLGIALGYIEYLILRPKPLVTEFSLNSILVPAIILLVFTGLLEELVFRGLMQRAFMTELGTWGGLFFVSSVFAVLHFGYLSILDVIFVFSVAVIFGIITLYSGSVLGVTIAHGLTNLTLFLIFPFLLGHPVSLIIPPIGQLQPQPLVWMVHPVTEDRTELPPSISTHALVRIAGIANSSDPRRDAIHIPSTTVEPLEQTLLIDQGNSFVLYIHSMRRDALALTVTKFPARGYL